MSVGGQQVPFTVKTEGGRKIVYFSAEVTGTYRAVEVQTSGQEPPQLSAAPASINFSAVQGGPVADQQATISNAGGGSLSWMASTPAADGWLSATPTSGTGPGVVGVHVNTTGLAPGSCSSTVTVTASGAIGSPLEDPVTLTVSQQPRDIYALNHGSRAALLADSWDIVARTGSGGSRNTEVTTGSTVDYSTSGLQIPADTGGSLGLHGQLQEHGLP